MTVEQIPEVVRIGDSDDGDLTRAGIDGYLRECARKVDRGIMALLDAEIDDPWMRAAISYQFGWADTRLSLLPPDRWSPNGKKLRPALALLCYESAFSPAGRPVSADSDD